MERNIVACSHNHCSYEHTTGNSHSVVDLYVAVDSIKPLDVRNTRMVLLCTVFELKDIFTALNNISVDFL